MTLSLGMASEIMFDFRDVITCLWKVVEPLLDALFNHWWFFSFVSFLFLINSVHDTQNLDVGATAKSWLFLRQSNLVTKNTSCVSRNHSSNDKLNVVIDVDRLNWLVTRRYRCSTTFGVEQRVHDDLLNQAEQAVLDGTSKWSCKIACTGEAATLSAYVRTMYVVHVSMLIQVYHDALQRSWGSH